MNCIASHPRTRTQNGNQAFNAEDIPHQQNLTVRGRQACGGVL